MSATQEVTYRLDFEVRGRSREGRTRPGNSGESGEGPIPRIARLMALAIRMEGLVREGAIRDYAELARRGWVTRARITQITKLLDLAPDIQEQILFLVPLVGLNERHLRPIVKRIDWYEQRQLFGELRERLESRKPASHPAARPFRRKSH